jgi:carboxymethylenebutenolidase
LNAVADFVKKLPAANGKLAVTGYCWGGGQSFRFATNRKDLSAAFVFYGTPPDAAAMANINAPVYGFYAGNDARVDATIPTATDAMKASGKKYDPVTYDGAGHGFMRAGEDPANTVPANVTAHDQAWQRWLTLLKAM